MILYYNLSSLSEPASLKNNNTKFYTLGDMKHTVQDKKKQPIKNRKITLSHIKIKLITVQCTYIHNIY